MERTDDLQIKGLRIIQDTDLFMFGTDSVLLCDFAKVKKNTRVLDIGTGTGVICFLLWARCETASYVGIDIQKRSIDLANRSKEMNKISNIEFLNEDLKDFTNKHSFDLVCSNPPYEKIGTGFTGGNEHIKQSRYETASSLDDVVCCAWRNLKPKGKFVMIYKAERLFELIKVMDKYGIELKRIRPIQKNITTAPRLILIEGISGGNSFVQWLPPLIMYDENKQLSMEVRRIYGELR